LKILTWHEEGFENIYTCKPSNILVQNSFLLQFKRYVFRKNSQLRRESSGTCNRMKNHWLSERNLPRITYISPALTMNGVHV